MLTGAFDLGHLHRPYVLKLKTSGWTRTVNLKSWVSSAKLTKVVRSTLAELVHFAPLGNQETGSDPGYGSDEEVESQVIKILVICPSRRYLYLSLALCVDHLVSTSFQQRDGYNNVILKYSL